MLVHDITDLAVTMFKLTVDITPLFITLFFYFTMLVSWVYFRLWFFPVHIIWNAY